MSLSLYIYIYMYICMCIYIYIYIYIYITRLPSPTTTTIFHTSRSFDRSASSSVDSSEREGCPSIRRTRMLNGGGSFMYGFYYNFNNLRFNKSQTSVICQLRM